MREQGQRRWRGEGAIEGSDPARSAAHSPHPHRETLKHHRAKEKTPRSH
jgi:hypothetical protein